MISLKTRHILSLIILGALVAAFCVRVNITQAKPAIADATFEIYPSMLNLLSRGEKVTCLIELSGGYDVNDIEISTVKLNESVCVDSVSPAIVGDYNSNNISDLMVTFAKAQIVDFILSENITYGNVTLTLSGVVSKVAFAGRASIMISRLIGDVNCDGVVSISDIVEAVAGFGTEEGEMGWNSNANFAPLWNRLDLHDVVTIAFHYGETQP